MRKKDFDTRLIIYKSRRMAITIAVAGLTAFFFILLAQNQIVKLPWFALVLPITGAGLTTLLIPMTEEWEYKPWQGKARRIEQQLK